MENRKRILEVKMDMLRIIGKQSGKTVESVVKKNRNAAVKDTVVYFCTGVHLA